jgi:hypothetical protein
MNGSYANGYASTVNNILIDHGVPVGYTWAFYLNDVRKITISNVHTSTKNGVLYTGRSAENVITNCNFVNYDESNMSGTKGLYCIANDEGYPEGLAVSKTLFYHFERNIHMTDMYSGHFSHLYLDSGATNCLENFLSYNQRFQFNTFSDIWCMGKGWVLGDDTYNSPKEFRTTFNNITLDFLSNHGFELKPWVRSSEFNNINMYGNGVAQVVGFILRNWNDFTRINGYTGRFTAGFIQVYGNGTNIESYAISNFDSLSNMGVYNEVPIKVNGVQM